MLRKLFMAKLRATTMHFGLSALIFVVLLYFILFHWYPGPWFSIDGGWQGVRIMILVDLVLGPSLTFLVFNPAKTRRALTFDFSCIAVAQACALAWGCYAVEYKRPLAVVYGAEYVYTIDEEVLEKQGKTMADYRQFGKEIPVRIFMDAPDTLQESSEVLERMLDTGLQEYQQFELYRPFDARALAAVHGWDHGYRNVTQQVPGADQRIGKWLQEQSGLTREKLIFLPFIGRYEEATLVLSPDGDILGSLPAIE